MRHPRDRRAPAGRERDRDRTADLMVGVYLGPFGARLHRFHLPGSDQGLIGPSLMGRATFPPGAKVTLARPSKGAGKGYAIAGRPPAGDQGGAQFSPRVYPPAPQPEEPVTGYYALLEDPLGGTALQAAIYDDEGNFDSLRASRTLAGSTAYAAGAQIIREDSSETVGPASFLLIPWGGELRVWDVDGAVDYMEQPLDTNGNPAAIWSFWRDGYVYWLQFDQSGSSYSYTLYRSRANLASPSALGSVAKPFAEWPTDPGDDVASEHTDATVQASVFFACRATDEALYFRVTVDFTHDTAAANQINELVTIGWDGTGGTIAPFTVAPWSQTNICTGIPRLDDPAAGLAAIDPPAASVGSPLNSISGAGVASALWPAVLPGWGGAGAPNAAIISLDALGVEALSLTRWHSAAELPEDVISLHAYRGTLTGEPVEIPIANYLGAEVGALFMR